MTFKNKILSTIIISTLLSPFTVQAADVLIMKNGDKLSGDILSRSPKRIRFQTDYGVLYVLSDTIETIQSADYSMTDVVGQRPTPTPQIVEPVMAPPSAPTPTATVENIATPVQDNTGLWGAKWKGNINAGAELKTGNSDSQALNIDGKTSANWDNVHRMTIGADYSREEENDVKVEDERELNAAYDYFYDDKWFWNNKASIQQDKIDNLDSRLKLTSGLGYQFYEEDDLKLEVTFGPGYQREKYENLDADSSMTANWTFDYEQAFYDDFVRLFHNHDLTAPTDELSSWLFESKSGVKVPLKAGIIATGEIDFDWNNNAPAPVVEDDTTYRLKLGYEWP